MSRMRRYLGISVMTLSIGLLGNHGAAMAQQDQAFAGKIAISAKDSVPAWPTQPKAPQDAPNVVVILEDDIGFGDTGTFGGVPQTPGLERLAKNGLRFNNFNTTAMCSPTRAALLTGRNHHRVGFGALANFAGGYPGYNAIWRPDSASIAQVLKQNGYSTAAIGKWHNTPDWETSQAGPFDRWPTGLGFDHFYGFMGPNGADSQVSPTRLYNDTTPIDPPRSEKQGYEMTADLADQSIKWLRTHRSIAPDKPYFLYLATGAVHAPHHVSREWIDRYKGKFDQGWDKVREEILARQKKLGVVPGDTKLTRRPKEIPAWSSLSADEKKLFARQMEVYAAFVAYADSQIGRVIEEVRSAPGGDNTIIIYIVGDNGGSGHFPTGLSAGTVKVGEQLKLYNDLGSGRVGTNIYAAGWAMTGATPFQWSKTVASHFGGTRNPMVISWPKGIAEKGGLRSQFTHITDVAPTLYDLIGIKAPAEVNGARQLSLDGASFAQTLTSAHAKSLHTTQYFEMLGNRALYKEGWVAAAHHQTAFEWAHVNQDYDHDKWELYDTNKDFSEANDLAAKYPEKLAQLKAEFDQEARRNSVYPLGGYQSKGVPKLVSSRKNFTFYPEAMRIPPAALPNFANGHDLIAEVNIPSGSPQGVVAQYGDVDSGFIFYLKEGYPVLETKLGPLKQAVRGTVKVGNGPARIRFTFTPTGPVGNNGDVVNGRPGTAKIYVNDAQVGQGPVSFPVNAGSAGLFMGRSQGSTFGSDVEPPFKLNGDIAKIDVTLP